MEVAAALTAAASMRSMWTKGTRMKVSSVAPVEMRTSRSKPTES